MGAAICVTLAREGANVAFNYSRSGEEAEVVRLAIEAHGVKAWAYQVSVLDKAGLQQMVRTLEQEAGVKMMQAPVHYSAAKAALKGMTEALAKEVGRYGITVNCLAPGVLNEGVGGNLPASRQAKYLRHCALGRLGTVQEVAEVVAFFVSDRNSYMSGATVVVDGAV